MMHGELVWLQSMNGSRSSHK